MDDIYPSTCMTTNTANNQRTIPNHKEYIDYDANQHQWGLCAACCMMSRHRRFTPTQCAHNCCVNSKRRAVHHSSFPECCLVRQTLFSLGKAAEAPLGDAEPKCENVTCNQAMEQGENTQPQTHMPMNTAANKRIEIDQSGQHVEYVVDYAVKFDHCVLC